MNCGADEVKSSLTAKGGVWPDATGDGKEAVADE